MEHGSSDLIVLAFQDKCPSGRGRTRFNALSLNGLFQQVLVEDLVECSQRFEQKFKLVPRIRERQVTRNNFSFQPIHVLQHFFPHGRAQPEPARDRAPN